MVLIKQEVSIIFLLPAVFVLSILATTRESRLTLKIKSRCQHFNTEKEMHDHNMDSGFLCLTTSWKWKSIVMKG